MASTGGAKRSLPPKVAKMMARKRQKLQNQQPAAASSAAKKKSGPGGNSVRLDDLHWQEVALPDQMDDYEGFFGLEEIDGVDVVRDGDGATMSYHLVDAKSQPKNRAGGNEIENKIRQKNLPPTSAEPNVDEDEWLGFDNVDEATAISKPAEARPRTEREGDNLNGATKKSKTSKTSDAKQDGDLQLETTDYALLEDQNDEQDVDVSAWSALNLSQEILSSLSKLGFARPTEIQSSAIPLIREGHDLIGKAPTGSGKTLAFGIPIIEELLAREAQELARKKSSAMEPAALIILPTRELAHQITAHLQSLLSGADLGDKITIATLTGGLSIEKQRRHLAGAKIVVGTPGRLWEVISDGQGVLKALKQIEFLVVDEADRLLSEGSFKELEEILNALDKQITHDTNSTAPRPPQHSNSPKHRQTLVFSATLSKSLHQSLSRRTKFPASASKHDAMAYLLQKLNFRSGDARPRFVDINPVTQMAVNLREGIVECPASTDKDLYLYTLLLYHHPGVRALIFVNSIDAVRRLVPLLNNLGLTTYPLHSHMIQKARLRSIERFALSDPLSASTPSSQDTKLLVATDVAARGLDIPNISLILHYHLPRTPDAYVHRSGRTARAAATGSSILLCGPDDAAGVRRLMAHVHASSSSDGKRSKSKPTRKSKSKSTELHTLHPDARLAAALKPRVALAKRIADADIAGSRAAREAAFFREARADLGASSSEEGDNHGDDDEHEAAGAAKGRGERKARGRGKETLSKGQFASLRAELQGMLRGKVNVGVSERYLVGRGGEEVQRLLRERDGGGSAADGTGAAVSGAASSVGGRGFAGGAVLGTVESLGWEV